MASVAPRSGPSSRRQIVGTLHALLLGCVFSWFLGALVADWAYAATGEIQWLNFAAWLIVGALLFAGATLAWAIIGLFKADGRQVPAYRLYVVLLASTFVTGIVNALVHAKDASATMPEGLIVSVLTLALLLATLWPALGGRVPGLRS